MRTRGVSGVGGAGIHEQFGLCVWHEAYVSIQLLCGDVWRVRRGSDSAEVVQVMRSTDARSVGVNSPKAWWCAFFLPTLCLGSSLMSAQVTAHLVRGSEGRRRAGAWRLHYFVTSAGRSSCTPRVDSVSRSSSCWSSLP